MEDLGRFTDMVAGSTRDVQDPRLKTILTSLIRHLHEFVIDVNLSLDEFLYACDFIERAGKISNGGRSEMDLMANILGVEVLVDMLSNTETNQTTVLGPMYRPDAPSYSNGSSIIKQLPEDGETAFVEGFVRDADGKPLAGALLDIWQTSTNELYDLQDPQQPDMNLRGRFRTDEHGHYAVRCLRPTSYPIPTDGPGGELLKVLQRHPMRPAHIHFIVSAPGKKKIVSQLYDDACAYVGNDSIFAVKDSLVLKFEPAEGRAETKLYSRYDWTLFDDKTATSDKGVANDGVREKETATALTA